MAEKKTKGFKITMKTFNEMSPEEKYYPGTTISKFPLIKPKAFIKGPGKREHTKNEYYYFEDGRKDTKGLQADLDEYDKQKKARANYRKTRERRKYTRKPKA